MSNKDAGAGAGKKGEWIPKGTPEQMANIEHLLDVARLAMEQQDIPKEVQEEALRAISTAAAQAGAVDAAQLDAVARSAEARGTFFAEALRQADSAEERQRIFDSFVRADEQDREERKETGERSTTSQRGFAKIGARALGIAAAGAGLMLAGAASVWAARK